MSKPKQYEVFVDIEIEGTNEFDAQTRIILANSADEAQDIAHNELANEYPSDSFYVWDVFEQDTIDE